MLILGFCLLVIGFHLITFYHGLNYRQWGIGMFLLLCIASALSILNWPWILLFTLLWIPLGYSPIRQTIFTQPAFNYLKKVMPPLSKTEKIALKAGTVGWDAELFSGKPNWKKLDTFPPPKLTPEEQAFLEGPVNELCEMTNDFRITHEGDLPKEVWQFLKKKKFFALIIQKKYGGLDFSAYAQSVILQKLAGQSMLLASTVGVPNSLGPGELLQHYGTEQQKNHYLPMLANGSAIPCFALTSPEAGSDAASIPDEGIVEYGQWQGKSCLGMRLTWNKRYITLAPIATVLGLAFQLKDPNHYLGKEANLGITCALIPTHLAGIKIGRRHFPLNIPFQNGPTQAKNLFVPLDFIIGGKQMAGQGWKMLMECLSIGRGITLPANTTGGAKSTALAIGAYAKIRRQFHRPIGAMEGIEAPLARIASRAYMMDAATELIASSIDNGERPSVLSAIVKYHCTHLGQQCAIDGMDIAGGKGICLGEHNFMGRIYQGAPIAVTVEGANILTRSMMIFGQGAIRCHPYLKDKIALLEEKDSEEIQQKFDALLRQHIQSTLQNATRSFWLGIFAFKHQSHTQTLNRYSANLAWFTDLSLALLGGKLKHNEHLSGRLADVLSHLYLASATLKRFKNEGEKEEDKILFERTLAQSFYEIEQALKQAIENYPIRWAKNALKWTLFPTGARAIPPSDKMDHHIAQQLQCHNATRDRLGRHQYLKSAPNSPMGQLELALIYIEKADVILTKIAKETGKTPKFVQLDKLAKLAHQKGWITESETKWLIETEKHRLNTINVDDFDPDALFSKSTPPNVDHVA